MADDSLQVQKDEVSFNPCTTPKGMRWYKVNVLSPIQQKLLNELKIDAARENNEYLARHPEIRAITSLLLRAVLLDKPKLRTVADYARDFFSRPKSTLQAEIRKYMQERGDEMPRKGDSAVNLPNQRLIITPSLEDFGPYYKQEYMSYISFTTEESPAEESVVGEWSEWQYGESSAGSASITDFSTTDAEYQTKQFDLMLSSKASTYSAEEEGYDEVTVDLAREYMRYYTDGDRDVTEYDEYEHMVMEELELAEEIQSKLSIIIENIEEEDSYGQESYEEQLDKRSIIEFDLDSLKEKSHSSGLEQNEESSKSIQILETMLEYEYSVGG